MDQSLTDRLDDLAIRYHVGVDPAYSRDSTGVWYSVPSGQRDPGWQHVSIAGSPVWWLDGVDLPGALATTGAAHHHGNALARAERHLAGDAIGPKRRRRYRRLLARVG